MRRFLVSLILAFLFVATVVITWAPPAKSGGPAPPPVPVTDCLEFCQDNPVCLCVKGFFGSLRLTKCKLNVSCVSAGEDSIGQCDCGADPICKPFIERDLVLQSFPPVGDPSCELSLGACGDGIDNDADGLIDCADPDCAAVCP